MFHVRLKLVSRSHLFAFVVLAAQDRQPTTGAPVARPRHVVTCSERTNGSAINRSNIGADWIYLCFLGAGTHPHHVGFHACEKTVALFFERFPYVCPEPVLVKCSCYLELARKGQRFHIPNAFQRPWHISSSERFMLPGMLQKTHYGRIMVDHQQS